MTESGKDNDSQMKALILCCAGPDSQDISIHLEDVGTTYKSAMDTLNNHFEPQKNVIFKRSIFRQAIQGQRRPSIIFVARLHKLPSTCKFSNQNTKIRDLLSNRLRCHIAKTQSYTKKFVEKAQAMEVAKKQSII